MAPSGDKFAREPVAYDRGALASLNTRSREIFKRIVDSYLATGDPMGDRKSVV